MSISTSLPAPILEFAAATNDFNRAKEVADELGGDVFIDQRFDRNDLPFRALATVVSDDIAKVSEIADVGLYVICRRLIKPGSANVFALFPLVHKSDITHREADAHWRDVHAPLALEHHGFMTHYSQLSVVHQVSGLALDGFALCGFESTEDLRQRFYTAPPSQQIIGKDILSFADTKKSPRRLIAINARQPIG